jgi:hypothetical protein
LPASKKIQKDLVKRLNANQPKCWQKTPRQAQKSSVKLETQRGISQPIAQLTKEDQDSSPWPEISYEIDQLGFCRPGRLTSSAELNPESGSSTGKQPLSVPHQSLIGQPIGKIHFSRSENVVEAQEGQEDTYESHFKVTELRGKPADVSLRQPRLSFATTCLSYSPERKAALSSPDSPVDFLERIDRKLRNQGLRFLNLTSEKNFTQVSRMLSSSRDLYGYYQTLNQQLTYYDPNFDFNSSAHVSEDWMAHARSSNSVVSVRPLYQERLNERLEQMQLRSLF